MRLCDVPSLSLRHSLREWTRDVHAALDRSVGAIEDEPGYRGYLRGLYAFRAAAEAAVRAARIPDSLADWRFAPLAERIGADLDDLGEPRPVPGAPWNPPDASGAAGVLYVLEGAVIGANVLRGRAARLGFDEGHGARHLARPEETGRWAAFVARLDAANDICPHAARKGARATFHEARRAFARMGSR